MLETSSSCFRPAATKTIDINPSSSAPTVSGKPNVTTCIYQTPDLGLISLTWYRNVIGRSLQIDFRLDSACEISTSFNLHIKPFLFWRRNGSKSLNLKDSTKKSIQIYWNLSKAKFGSDPDPEPKSGFFVGIVVDGVMILVVGDLQNEAYSKTKATMKKNPEKQKNNQQVLVLRREDVVFGTSSSSRFSYSTKTKLGGKTRDISIDCCSSIDDDDDDEENKQLWFSIDGEKVVEIKRLKWKFRGNEIIEIDGRIPIHISWDVYSWLFQSSSEGHAVFMFRFENDDADEEEEEEEEMINEKISGMITCGFGFGLKKRRCYYKSTSYSSSSSSTMSSSVSSSSVMEWANTEDSELDPPGFSLLIHAWKKN
ncbi:hypothetical protein C5167_022415 [Papaver somniferum]|uniref:Uncharacterized protein n=1 Tax=Papaver somniferum TaxID=3469 RepID=A0A4Y7JJC0_PAPSO|nr:uncharacterized protein LOC113279004 [Papaver somniferum]RZC60656.1 hypothetical protein C5167_022415 [Papaver somniferum]